MVMLVASDDCGGFGVVVRRRWVVDDQRLASPACWAIFGREEREGKNGIVHWRKSENFFSYMGPRFLVFLAYIDPGNFETDLQSGAQYKYGVSILPMMLLYIAFIIRFNYWSNVLEHTEDLKFSCLCLHQ
ncbi:hypothetical protein Dimus_022817, partial [Dionaea muscipula]